MAFRVSLTISHNVNILAKSEFISSVQPRDLVYLNVLQGINRLPLVLKIGVNFNILLTYAIDLIKCCGSDVSCDKF